MKSFAQYFKYHFKSTLLRLIIVLVIALALSLASYGNLLRFHEWEWGLDRIAYVNVKLGWYTFIFASICMLIPVLELSNFKSRRNLDTMFTLPVSRTKMLLAHLLNGWIHITLAFTAEAIVIFTALRQAKYSVHESYFFGYYFALLAVGLAIYLFFAFIFSQANTIMDGIIFMGAWTFVFGLPIEVFELDNSFDGDLIAYSPFIKITKLFTDLMEIHSHDKINSESYLVKSVNVEFIFWVAVGIVSAVLLYFTFKKQRVERVEDISTTPIGYKFLVPFLGISVIWETGNPIIGIVILIIMLIGYIIYRRSVRLKISDLIMLGIAFLTIWFA